MSSPANGTLVQGVDTVVPPANNTVPGNGTFPVVDPARAAESNTTLFLTIVCVVWSCAFCTAMVRFYTRALIVRSFGKDDVFMVLSVLCGIGGLVSWIIACKNGYGKHQDTISRAQFQELLAAQFFQSVIEASFAFGLLKISIALSLLRLSRGHWYRWILWALIGFTCFYTIFAFITFLTFCQPISSIWNFSIRPRCYNRVLYRDFGLFNTACNMFTDVVFATLPIPLIWSLQLQRRVRIYLILILSGGYFAVALGVARAIFIIAFVHERDGTFYPWAPFFASLQLDIGIIAACAPTLRPLLGQALKLSASLNHYRAEANYYRAGKALDRLPHHHHLHHHQGGSGGSKKGNEGRGYLRQNTESGDFGPLGLELGLKGLGLRHHHSKTGEGSNKRRGGQKWGTAVTTVVGGPAAAVASEKNSDTKLGFSATAVHEENAGGTNSRTDREGNTSGSEDGGDGISPLVAADADFKGIVKTTEFRVEK